MNIRIQKQFVVLALTLVSICSQSNAQSIDTAFFLNTVPPLSVKIEGEIATTNHIISRIEKSTNSDDSVYLDLYWKGCVPNWPMVVPYDTIVSLDISTPDNFTLRIRSYYDTNTTVDCTIRDSIIFLFDYDLFYSTAEINELHLNERQRIKIVDIMGRDSEDIPNTFLIYIYSDGTIEKVFRFE